MIQVANLVKGEYSEAEQQDIDDMALILTGWQGDVGNYDSVAAAVYSYIRVFYGMSLFSCMTDIKVKDRMGYMRGMYSIHFVEWSIRLLTDSSEGGTHWNPVCNQPDK